MASMKDSAGNLKGTNIPYDSINANRRDEIGRIIVDAIAIGNWRSANDQLFKAAYWSNVGREQGQGGGNPAVGAVQVGDYRIDGSPHPWAAYAINTANDVYNTNVGMYSWDDKLGVLLDGKSIGSWGGQAHTEQDPKHIDDEDDLEGAQTGKDPADVGVTGKPPVEPVVTGGGDDDLKKIWPDVDWAGGEGADTGGKGQYDYWNKSDGGVDDGLFGEYGPTVTKGLFGFSDERPKADFSKHPYSYLNAYNIGHNLAYKPWHSAAWRGPETEEEIADKTTPRTYYGGIPGGTDTRDQLYYYGGVGSGGKVQPMQVPGGWKTATLPSGAQSVYPISRTPLFPSGELSPMGPVAAYVKPVVDDDNNNNNNNNNNNDETGEDVLGIGKKLAQYAGRAAVKGGISTSGQNLMYRVSGEPEEISISPRSGSNYRTWGNLPIDVWNAGDVYKTTAFRPQTGKDWTDANNIWSVDLTADMREQGGMSQFNIKFADWAGGVPTSTTPIRPTLDFLGDPQNQWVTDPDSHRRTKVPYTLPTSYGKSYSTGGSSFLDPTKLETTFNQPWGRPGAMSTPSFEGYGGRWIMPGIYGQDREDNITQNLLGYGLPRFLQNQFTEFDDPGDLTRALSDPNIFAGENPGG